MAVPESELPQRFDSSLDVTRVKAEETLGTYSRRNWLSYATQHCVSHYGFPGLSYLGRQAVVLRPREAEIAARELSGLLAAIENDPSSLSELLQQDAWSAEEICALLKADTSPSGPLYESDDGDELPYMLTFLKSHRALLFHASTKDLHVIYAQSP